MVRISSSLFLINANTASSIRELYHQLVDIGMGRKAPGSKVTGTGTALSPDAGLGPLHTKDNWYKAQPDNTCCIYPELRISGIFVSIYSKVEREAVFFNHVETWTVAKRKHPFLSTVSRDVISGSSAILSFKAKLATSICRTSKGMPQTYIDFKA